MVKVKGLMALQQNCQNAPLAQSALHAILSRVWRSGCITAEWKDDNIVSLHKEQGTKSTCSSY